MLPARCYWSSCLHDRGAYLGPAHRAAIAQAAARKPAAILLVIGNPGDDRFAYNVTQEDQPWPMPVMVVAAKDKGTFERNRRWRAGDARRRRALRAECRRRRNVVARLGAGKGPAIVASTPMTGWYSCVCERGPGIANFLALARTVAAEKVPGDFVFVATAGHEIGHGGMELFLKQGAPPQQDTLVWVHFGASNACYSWTAGPQGFTREDKVDVASRAIVLSPSACVAGRRPALSRSRRGVLWRRSRRSANCATFMRPAIRTSSAWPACIASSIRRPTIFAPPVRRFSNRWPAPLRPPSVKLRSVARARSNRSTRPVHCDCSRSVYVLASSFHERNGVMSNFTPVSAAIGGALIGLSSVLLMLLTGRIAGISGIFSRAVERARATTRPGASPSSRGWCWCLIVAGSDRVRHGAAKTAVKLGRHRGGGTTGRPRHAAWRRLHHPVTAFAGSGGCRTRSIAATIVFMVTAVITVVVTRHMLGG